MTTNFQPGDKVRVKPSATDGPVHIGLAPGVIYTVEGFAVADSDLAGIRIGGHYYHPSHFELVERAAPAETYCLLDGDGDWWVFDADADRWQCRDSGTSPWYTSRYDFERGVKHLIACHGIDAEPLPSRKYPTTAEYLAAYGAEDDGGEYETEMALAYDEADPTPFVPGDRVEYVGGGEVQSPPLIGKLGTVASIGDEPDDINVEWDDVADAHHGVLAENLRKVTDPAPLQPGDAVLVWATVGEPDPDDGDIQLGTPTGDGRNDWFHAKPDAIVRPSAGQVPPWLEAEQAEAKAISIIKTALVVEGGMHDDRYTQQTAESLYRAGIRPAEGGAS